MARPVLPCRPFNPHLLGSVLDIFYRLTTVLVRSIISDSGLPITPSPSHPAKLSFTAKYRKENGTRSESDGGSHECRGNISAQSPRLGSVELPSFYHSYLHSLPTFRFISSFRSTTSEEHLQNSDRLYTSANIEEGQPRHCDLGTGSRRPTSDITIPYHTLISGIYRTFYELDRLYT